MGKNLLFMQTAQDLAELNVSSFCITNRLRLAAHPPYSRDLAPSNFFLVGHLNRSRQGMVFPSHEQLMAAILEMVTAIPEETLQGMSEHWTERHEWVSQNNPDWYE
jgi:hypothetical protein